MNETLRENVLFGEPLDRQRYEAALRDCQLVTDLNLLPAGPSPLLDIPLL